MQSQRALRSIAVSQEDLARLLRSLGIDSDPRSHGIPVGDGPHQLHLQPVAIEGRHIFEQGMAVTGGGHRNIHDSTVPEVRHCDPATVDDQISAGGISDLRKSPVAIAAQMAIALPSMPGGSSKIFRIKEKAG